jgi:hypothetical protein
MDGTRWPILTVKSVQCSLITETECNQSPRVLVCSFFISAAFFINITPTIHD